MPISSLSMPLSILPEHKIGFFVRFLASGPLFSGISSTKSAFLCAFRVRNPHFLAFRAQNRGFCALLPSETPVFGHFEHKIGVFVLFWPSGPPFLGFSSTKSAFLCSGSMCWGVLGSCYSGRAARGVLLLPGGVLPGGGVARGVARSICWLQGVRRALF